MSIEEKIRTHYEISCKIKELELQKKELGFVILQQMTQKTVSIAEYTVRKYEKLLIKTSLEKARLLHATKTEEVLDKDRLKQLHKEGQSIEGISTIQFIQVSSGIKK